MSHAVCHSGLVATLTDRPDSPVGSADDRADHTAPGGPATRAGRAWVLALAAGGPIAVSFAAMSALMALVFALTPGATLSLPGVFGAAGPAWLAAFHVPLTVLGQRLGALPLLPTVLMIALVARTSSDAAGRLGASTPAGARPVLVAVAVTHAVFGAVLAAASSGVTAQASPVVAFFACGVLAGLAATIGTARPAGLLRAALARADEVTRLGLRAGVVAAIALLGVGALVLAASLAGSWPTAAAMFRREAPGFGAGLGMLLLSVAYLPNVVVGVSSFVAGPGFSMGAATFGPLVSHPGPVPALPILAAVPAEAHRWSMVLLLLSAGVGVLVGWMVRGLPGSMLARCRAVGVAAVVVGLIFLVLAGMSGGALGGGRFDPVTVPAGLLAVSLFVWVAVVGSGVAWVTRGRLVDHPNSE